MGHTGRRLVQVQSDLADLEADHKLAGLEPIALAETQTPLFEGLRESFKSVGETSATASFLSLTTS